MSKIERANILPSSDADRKKLKGFITEAVNAHVMIDAQKAKLKEIKDTCLETFPITKELLNQLINFENKGNYQEVASKWEDMMEAWDKLDQLED